jgi:hypothetical protein
MRSTYLFLSVAAPLASAFVIPDGSVLAEIVSETRPAANGQLSKADVKTSLVGISPDRHRGWGRDGDWPDDDDDDECPKHGDWPGCDEDPHEKWPGSDCPGRGGWPDDDDDDQTRRLGKTWGLT